MEVKLCETKTFSAYVSYNKKKKKKKTQQKNPHKKTMIESNAQVKSHQEEPELMFLQ